MITAADASYRASRAAGAMCFTVFGAAWIALGAYRSAKPNAEAQTTAEKQKSDRIFHITNAVQ